MKKIPLLALLFLTGCFATADQMYLPDGSSGYRISCSGYMGEASDCIQKASDLCGANGYQTYDQNGKLKNDDVQTQAVIAAINNGAAKRAATTTTADAPKSMFIKCKSTDMPLRLSPAPTPQVDNKPMPLGNTPPPAGK